MEGEEERRGSRKEEGEIGKRRRNGRRGMGKREQRRNKVDGNGKVRKCRGKIKEKYAQEVKWKEKGKEM